MSSVKQIEEARSRRRMFVEEFEHFSPLIGRLLAVQHLSKHYGVTQESFVKVLSRAGIEVGGLWSE